MGGQLHAPAALLQVTTESDAGRAPEPVSTFRRSKRNMLPLPGIETRPWMGLRKIKETFKTVNIRGK
jgi:hypothetical protein